MTPVVFSDLKKVALKLNHIGYPLKVTLIKEVIGGI
jgi:hypothetical protein